MTPDIKTLRELLERVGLRVKPLEWEAYSESHDWVAEPQDSLNYVLGEFNAGWRTDCNGKRLGEARIREANDHAWLAGNRAMTVRGLTDGFKVDGPESAEDLRIVCIDHPTEPVRHIG